MPIQSLPSAAHCRLWRVDLDARVPAADLACLSDEERARALRFVFDHDRSRYVAAHAALRHTLSACSGIPAADLRFDHGTFGKPALAEPAGLRFNLSHSQSVGLIAIGDAAGIEIGVDVELLRPMEDAEALARAYFTPAEERALAALAPAEREHAFLRCWTRKEACLKATGMGLGVDTRSFEVGIGAEPCEVRMAGDAGELRLALCSFDGGADAVCAVARVLAPATAAARDTLDESELYA